MGQVDVAETARELRLVVGRLVRRARGREDLPSSQVAVIGYLDRDGSMSTSELAQLQRVRHQSMARTVGQLEDMGLVERRPHPQDGRKSLIVLTDAGREVIEAQRERRADWLAEAITAELSEAERERLAEAVGLLGRLADHD
ncbi:MarR family transcriptional regulator [Actinomadura barringtoniae]|uniref:MarR family transcriptional regulator n=1 Tax=Actinomadura barringtoniae TaxID=1427535 RepID=A0A939PA12_9ACTN|nr:MarR family transcriptional regulator [Actinomadura barringtoniae]MBO2448932.1 MarR family transcriptional regulator [Actinomadura barringtoniae]